MLRSSTLPWCALLGSTLLLSSLAPPAAAQLLVIEDTTVTETVVVPADEDVWIAGVVTLDGGDFEVNGDLRTHGTTVVNGAGQVRLNPTLGRWRATATRTPRLTIESGIEVVGANGVAFSTPNTINRGLLAAIDGGADRSEFGLFVRSGFVNEGVLEARDGGRLTIHGAGDADFVNDGVLRALPGGIVRLWLDELASFDQLGTIDNQGLFELNGEIDAAGATVELPSGEWELQSFGTIRNTRLTAAPGGRLEVRPRITTIISDTPATLDNATLATDLFLGSSSHTEVLNSLTLEDAALRIVGGAELLLDAAAPITGVGEIVAEEGTGRITATGAVQLPATIPVRTAGGSLRLTGSGFGAGVAIAGPVEVSSGTFSVQTPTTLDGPVTTSGEGLLHVLTSTTSTGDFRVESGGTLNLDNALVNQGAVTINNARLILESGAAINGSGAISVADSAIVSSSSRTLSDFLSFDGVRIERVLAGGNLDLEGATLLVEPTANERWSFTGGVLTNGSVGTGDGSEWVLEPAPGDDAAGTTLQDIDLLADAGVRAGATLAIRGPVGGSGDVILDGGSLHLLRDGEDPRAVLDRLFPVAGEVVLAGRIDNVGQTVTLAAGVDWVIDQIRTDTFIGGRVEAEPGASLRVRRGYGSAGQATLRQNVTLATPVLIENTRLYAREGLTLDGAVITIGEPNGNEFADGRLVFIGEQTLDGVGEVRFNRIDDFQADRPFPRINIIEVSADSERTSGLTIGAGITVRTSEGSGYIGDTYFYQSDPLPARLTNHGSLIAENGHRLSLFVGDFAQHGVLRAEAGSTLEVIADPFGEDQTLTNSGRLEAAGGVVAFSSHLTLAADSTLAWDLDPPSASLAVISEGTVTLGGTLEVTATGDPWTPAAGETFLMMAADGGFTGSFASRQLPTLPTGLYWSLDTGVNTLALSILDGAPAGDFNSDGVVDAADYTLARDLLGQPVGLPNETVTPGEVTPEDLAAWRANYGAVATPPTATVPEPTTLAIGMVIAVSCVSRRR